MTSRERIDDFLRQKRLAIAGVSRQPSDFTRMMFNEFVRRGYDVVPVNPSAGEIDGRKCFARLQEIDPPVDGVLVMTKPAAAEAVVQDCAEAGVKRVWLYRATGAGAVSRKAVELCEARSIDVIAGGCPFMFWADSSFFHRVHGVFARLTGSYPR
jgi:uncharacterized protein